MLNNMDIVNELAICYNSYIINAYQCRMSKEKGGIFVNDKRTGYKKLDFSSLKFAKKVPSHIVDEQISPIKWANNVLNGEKQVLIKK